MRLGAATRWYDQPRQPYYLLVGLEVEVADATPEAQQRTVSAEVATDTENRTSFLANRRVRERTMTTG